MTPKQQVGVVVVVGLLVLVGLVFLFNPAENPLFPPCYFHQLTGLYCPGCGSTRAIHHLLHGHFSEAVRFNALVTLIVPVLLGCLVWEQLSHRVGRPWSFSRLSPTLVWTLVSVLLLFGVARNIPWYPFTVMAP